MSNNKDEEMLTGGNVSKVFRSGDTVWRELKPTSYKIQKLLNQLENKGYSYAPKFLGIDEKGGKILSYIEGEASNYPLKEYMWSDNVLIELAKMLRLYHDSVSDFPFDNSWQSIDYTPKQFEVICHNDFAMYNIIFHHEKPAGIIDFDFAGPGPRLWDIAYTLYTCVPFSRFYLSEIGEEVQYSTLKHASHTKRSFRLFFESYGERIKVIYMEKTFVKTAIYTLELV